MQQKAELVFRDRKYKHRSTTTCSGAPAHVRDQPRKISRRWSPASKVTASQLCGRETKESRQQSALAHLVARSRASGGGAPFDPRGPCQQGATQRDLHPTTSDNRRQALCVWLRAESKLIRQRLAQTARGGEAEATCRSVAAARESLGPGHCGMGLGSAAA